MIKIPNKVINYKDHKKSFINFCSDHKKIILPFLFILFYILFYFLLDFSTQSLVPHDEGLYARRSRLVEESYNWFSSPFDKPHHKTIGSYWFIALSIRLFGYSELALRLPSIFFSFLCLFISYLIGTRIANKKAALISVFSLSAMPLWLQYSRYASPDIPFVLCILLVILFFLKFLDAKYTKNKYLYIFLSGIFVSTGFFIRSYMVIVPLVGLAPFLIYNLNRSKDIFKFIFITGIFFGSIPTSINLFFSYKKFGFTGISVLFDFAKDKAVGGIDFNNLLLIPLNYLYLTFPVGILLILLLVFTSSINKINYPLLFYCYPILSLTILLCMSTSYLHYYLFLLPPLSILFATKIQAFTFRFSRSKNLISLFLSIFITIICSAFLYLLIFNYDFIKENSYGKALLAYLVIFMLLLSLVASIRFLFDTKNTKYNLLKFLYNIIIPQYVSVSLLYNFGLVGNPSFKLKSFINDENVSSILKSNTIYLYNVDSKINTLLRYYLPSAKVVSSNEDILNLNYIITSDRNSLYEFGNESLFKSIKSFDNHFLLMNISK